MTEARRPTSARARAAPVEARAPGDKSISHRALLLAALAEGTSTLRGVLPAADTRATAAALRALGVAIPELPGDGGAIRIKGVGLRGLRADGAVLDCANSGTTARLLAGVLAASLAVRGRLDGDASLRRRPMGRVVHPLRDMGARIEVEDEAAPTLPLRVEGAALSALDHASAVASAQVKSALLLAGLVAGVPVRVSEPRLSRDHTERMLRTMGVRVASTAEGMRATAALVPVDRLAPLDLDVPGDPSSAAYLAALAAAVPGAGVRIRDVCLNPTRTAFFDALASMGAGVAPRPCTADEADREPTGDVQVTGRALRGIALHPAAVPALIDELPLLAALGAMATGETRITGAAELRVKESDRIATTAAALRAVGARVEELPDGLAVRGAGRPLRGSVVTGGDHRLAMAFGVLGAAPGNVVDVDDRACTDVSYPGFWSDLGRLRAAWGLA